MKKATYLVVLLLLSITVKAQKTIPFKIKYLPKHDYKMTMKMNMDMDMFIDGDSATMDKIKASGMKQPMVMQMNSTTSAEIKTGTATTTKTFPLTITYGESSSKATMNGADLPLPQAKLTGQTITGECNIDGKLHIDSLAGGGANEQTRKMVADLLNKLQEQVKFPEKPMAVGDSFLQDIPMSIPASGINLDMTVKTKYTLTAIKDDLAYFDIDLSMNLDMKTQKDGVNMIGKGDGNGGGKFVYSIKQNYATVMTNDLNMNFKLEINEMKMNMKLKMKSDIQNEIAKSN